MSARPVTVGTTATLLLPYNPDRTAVSIFNNDSAAIFVSEDQVGILAQGFPISAGSAVDLIRALGDNPQDILFAVSVAGGADVRLLEQFGELPVLFAPPGGTRSPGEPIVGTV